jgi:WXXGXW repeat (2 copies)
MGKMRTDRLKRFLLLALVALAVPSVSHAGIILSIGIAPPPLPVYDQPLCPGDGYIWTPGYWAYNSDDGYFWVPGTWVQAPEVGLLWTPGYWGWGDGVYVFHDGYWGPHVGFYGGIDYGFGYTGAGYAGGYWNNGAFFYNRSVNRVENVRNVYNKTVVNITVNHVSYNGGHGGLTARPTAEQQTATRDHHVPPTSNQTSHVQSASGNRQLYESQNHGKPTIVATSKPAEFSGHNVVAAKAAAPSYKPAATRSVSRTPENNAGARPNTAHTASPNTAKPAPAINARQENARPSQPKSEQQDHQRIAQHKPAEQPKPQVEPKRQPPAEQVQQKHVAAPERHAAEHVTQPRAQEKARPASKPESRPESKPPAPKEKEKK